MIHWQHPAYLQRPLKAGDLIVYYSPRELMGSGAVLKASTAAGRILDEVPYIAEQSACFHPYRHRVKFFGGQTGTDPTVTARTDFLPKEKRTGA